MEEGYGKNMTKKGTHQQNREPHHLLGNSSFCHHLHFSVEHISISYVLRASLLYSSEKQMLNLLSSAALNLTLILKDLLLYSLGAKKKLLPQYFSSHGISLDILALVVLHKAMVLCLFESCRALIFEPGSLAMKELIH